MDQLHDERDPWYRVVPEEMMGVEDLKQEEMEHGPPDEEYMGNEQPEQEEKGEPTALNPSASSDSGPSATPLQAAVLPLVVLPSRRHSGQDVRSLPPSHQLRWLRS